MATTGILRSRRSIAQLHALASVEREIRANDPAVGRKYLRDFRDAYRSYQRVLTSGQVRDEIAKAGIVLIGDYHALPNSQRYLASLLRDPALHRRPLVLGVETIFSRDQHILEEWMRGEIDEAELRQRTRFDLDWGYDWTPFCELLSAARDHAAAIYGLDCMPREDLRRIAARDRHAADKIAEIRRRHRDALILVLFGESHLAPRHLPAMISARQCEGRSKQSAQSAEPSPESNVSGTETERPMLTVLQNVDALYWRAAGEASDRVEAVEIGEHAFCVFNATPLEKYENYRLCLDRWRRDDSVTDLGPTLYNLIDGLVRFLGINRYSPHNTTQPRLLVDLMPEVYFRDSDALLHRLLSRKGFTAARRRSLLRRIRQRGSVYLAPLNAVYVRQFRMTSAAEDATRFLHQACRGLPYRSALLRSLPNRNHRSQAPALTSEDAFYLAVFEHALAYFGSRVLHPARPAFRDAELAELYELTHEDLEQLTALPFADAIDALDVINRLREFDRRNPRRAANPGNLAKGNCAAPQCLAQALAFNSCQYEYVSEQLGYLTGNDLYDAYVQGRLTPAGVRKLFLAHVHEPGIAREAYSQLLSRLR
ncbi:MAG: ChaN family lipoprotein [Terriglobales bacterium]